MHEIILTGIVVHVHECMLRLCILLNSLLYICKSELRKSQSGIKVFFFATVSPPPAIRLRPAWIAEHDLRGQILDLRSDQVEI